MFPVDLSTATQLYLSNEPMFHGELSKEATATLLSHPGEYLLQSGHEPNTFLLSVFHDGLKEYSIRIKETPSGPLFCIGRASFFSLDALLNHLKANSIKSHGERIQLTTAVTHRKVIGRFGAASNALLAPRHSKRSLLPIVVEKEKVVLVPLRKEIISEMTVESLETLISLKHRRLVSLLDFVEYRCVDFNRIVVKYEFFETNLYDYIRKKEDVKKRRILGWIRQAAEALHFLSENKCYNTVLCAQDCFIDGADNLKVGGAWRETWANCQYDTVKHPYYWRFCAPEVHLNQELSSVSLIWNLGVFAWQLATKCLLHPFSHHPTVVSLLNFVVREKLSLPGQTSLESEEGYSEKILNKLSKSIQKIETCEKLPEAMSSIIGKCTTVQKEERPAWTTVLQVSRAEANFARITTGVKRILPFA